MEEARRLALVAGLVKYEEQPQEIPEMPYWRSQVTGFIDSICPEQDHQRIVVDEDRMAEELQERRRERYRTQALYKHKTRAYLKKIKGRMQFIPDEAGIWSGVVNGKLMRSWLSNQPYATPPQIAWTLMQKDPNIDVDIVMVGRSKSTPSFAKMVTLDVPVYKAYVSPKLPPYLQTAESILLQYGKVLDIDSAKKLYERFQKGDITQTNYSEQLAKLCRNSPEDPEFKDWGWTELNDKGEIVPFEEDWTQERFDNVTPVRENMVYQPDHIGQKTDLQDLELQLSLGLSGPAQEFMRASMADDLIYQAELRWDESASDAIQAIKDYTDECSLVEVFAHMNEKREHQRKQEEKEFDLEF